MEYKNHRLYSEYVQLIKDDEVFAEIWQDNEDDFNEDDFNEDDSDWDEQI